MGSQDTVNVSFARKDDAISKLVNVNTVEIVQEAKVVEWRIVFRWPLEFLANASVDGRECRWTWRLLRMVLQVQSRRLDAIVK